MPRLKKPKKPMTKQGDFSRGSWPHAIACRDLAKDLSSIRRGADQTAVPMFNYQIDLVVELLESEHQKTETAMSEQEGRPNE